MTKTFHSIVAIAGTIIILASCSKDDNNGNNPVVNINKTVISAAGDNATVLAKLNEFRALAGDPLNSAPGATTGRREVNWDGVPANLTNTNNFPIDFFGSSDPTLANGRKRGLITGPGASFRVDSSDFSEIDPSYESQFEAFSPKKLFAYMGNVVTTVTFKVPGSATDAFVKSFAVIFSDVDVVNSTSVEYFNGNKSLGVFYATPASQAFSLVGVAFPDEKITEVKITSGNGLLATGVKDISNGGTKDLVVMDDFLYSEPQALQ
ncbi:MAG: hypothetical protein E6H09_04210 [Bacteroidetes bacterium]|nr:MAG: hypothetical protein E6H09_04210 [Bacteroidota bacterium]